MPPVGAGQPREGGGATGYRELCHWSQVDGMRHTCRSFLSRQVSTHIGLLRVHRAPLQLRSGQTARFQNFEEAPVWGHLGGQEGPVSLSLSSGTPASWPRFSFEGGGRAAPCLAPPSRHRL